jgi:hypothetical protein
LFSSKVPFLPRREHRRGKDISGSHRRSCFIHGCGRGPSKFKNKYTRQVPEPLCDPGYIGLLFKGHINYLPTARLGFSASSRKYAKC